VLVEYPIEAGVGTGMLVLLVSRLEKKEPTSPNSSFQMSPSQDAQPAQKKIARAKRRFMVSLLAHGQMKGPLT
jgi:hypothetical protein